MCSESSSEIVELTLVFLSDLSQGDNSGVLLVNQFSEGSFSLDECVWDVEFFAEVGDPDDEFDGFDVVSNNNELGLLLLNKFGDVVETELKMIRLSLGDVLLWVN